MTSFKKLQKALEQDALQREVEKSQKKEIIGLNLEECLDEAEKMFGVEKDKISYEVLEEGKKGFLGVKKSFVRILAYVEQAKAQSSSPEQGDDLSFSDEFAKVLNVEEGSQGEKKNQEPIQFVSRKNGVYLKVLKPDENNKKEVSIDEVIGMFARKNYQDFDQELVRRIVLEKKGEWIRIGEYNGNPDWERGIRVQVASDEMRAFLRIDSPLYWGRIPELEEVQEVLAEHGVNWGVKKEEIQKILEEQNFDTMHLIAEGKRVQNGKHATIKYHFNISGSLFSLEEDESGKVDFFGEFLQIQNVNVGQVLAEKIPLTVGEEGYKVTGETIVPNSGKDTFLKEGKNTSLSEDGLQVISNITGRALYKKGAIHVEPSFQVSGNVNSHTGSIKFAGDVMIRGSVEDAFSVDAGGNLYVGGSIGKSNVKAGGTIMVQRGILGCEETRVTAGGDIVAHFVENAVIESGERLIIREAILHSQVRAKNIYCLGKRGIITGGVIQAVENVYVKVLGSSSYTDTRVEVGQDPNVRAKLMDMEAQKLGLEEKLLQVRQHVETFQKKWRNLPGKNLNEEQKLKMEKALELKEEIESKLAPIQAEYERLKGYSDNLKVSGGLISASDRIYPKTEIVIRGKAMKIQKDQIHLTFGFKDGKIEEFSYLEPKDEEVLKLLEQKPGARKNKKKR